VLATGRWSALIVLGSPDGAARIWMRLAGSAAGPCRARGGSTRVQERPRTPLPRAWLMAATRSWNWSRRRSRGRANRRLYVSRRCLFGRAAQKTTARRASGTLRGDKRRKHAGAASTTARAALATARIYICPTECSGKEPFLLSPGQSPTWRTLYVWYKSGISLGVHVGAHKRLTAADTVRRLIATRYIPPIPERRRRSPSSTRAKGSPCINKSSYDPGGYHAVERTFRRPSCC